MYPAAKRGPVRLLVLLNVLIGTVGIGLGRHTVRSTIVRRVERGLGILVVILRVAVSLAHAV